MTFVSKFTKGRKEESQRCQLGHRFHSSCQVEVSKKKYPGSRASFSRELGSFFSVLLSREMSVVYTMGWRTQLFTNTMEYKQLKNSTKIISVRSLAQHLGFTADIGEKGNRMVMENIDLY